jgi:hypothetical protein
MVAWICSSAPLTHPNGSIAAGLTYLLYGIDSGADVDLANLTPSQGIRLDGAFQGERGSSVSRRQLSACARRALGNIRSSYENAGAAMALEADVGRISQQVRVGATRRRYGEHPLGPRSRAAATAAARCSQCARNSSSSSAVKCSIPTNVFWTVPVRISSSNFT